MTQYQKLLHEIYGEYIEAFGYKPTKNAWYKISSKGIASFIGTRLLRGGAMDFYITFQPVISLVSNHLNLSGNFEAPTTFTNKGITFYPLHGEDVYRTIGEITRKKLMENSDFKAVVTQKIRGIMEEHFEKYFTIDMSLNDCLSFQEEFERLFFLKHGEYKARLPRYNIAVIDIDLLLHQDYDVCLDYFYKRRVNDLLSHTILRQYFSRSEIEEVIWIEHLDTIYNTLCERPGLTPMEYITLFESMGMELKPSFDEQAYCDECLRIINPFADIIAALEADDYDKVLGILEEKHNKNAAVYREMKIEVPPFSSYFEG